MTGEGRDKTHLEMAEALDDMDKDLSSANAEFLEKVLRVLKDEKPLNAKQEAKLEALYHKYFVEEPDGNGDDIDEDDFV